MTISFSFTAAVGSVGAIGASGIGSGWASGASNFSSPFGNLTTLPNPPVFAGHNVAAVSYTSTGGFNNTIVLIIAGVVAQTAFTTMSVGALVLASGSATYSTSTLAGFSTWIWTAPTGNIFSPGGGTFHVVVSTAPPMALTIPSALPYATSGFMFSYQVAVTGGNPPYTYAISASPNTGTWLTISSTGLLSGTPPVGEPETITIQVKDSTGAIVTALTSLTVVDVTAAKEYTNLITSEHNQKVNFMQLVSILTASVGDVTAVTDFMVPAFTLGTAVGAQLDILGLWIGQSRKIDNILVIGFFGFSEVSTGLPDGLQETFGELTDPNVGGVWFNLGQADSGSTILDDTAYLTILKAKIVKNQWDGTVSGMEEALQFIVGVACAIHDTGNLTLQINVPVAITPLEEALLESLDLIPRPAGVRITSITFA